MPRQQQLCLAAAAAGVVQPGCKSLRTADQAPSVLGAEADSGVLAWSGRNVLTIAAVAGGLILLGVLLLLARRRRHLAM